VLFSLRLVGGLMAIVIDAVALVSEAVALVSEAVALVSEAVALVSDSEESGIVPEGPIFAEVKGSQINAAKKEERDKHATK
jgi:hypothetical protein